MKRANPPTKSPMMKLFSEVLASKNQLSTPTVEGGLESDAEMNLESIGCTANVILADYEKKKLFVANAGDSRCVMGHGNKCTPLSFDHKPESQTEIDRIYKAGSTISEGRVDGNLNLTRALGDLKYKQKTDLKPEEHPITANPDVFEYEMPSDLDFIFMGCDGVWERKSNDEMVEWIYMKLKQTSDLKQICADLLKNECLSPDYTQTSKQLFC